MSFVTPSVMLSEILAHFSKNNEHDTDASDFQIHRIIIMLLGHSLFVFLNINFTLIIICYILCRKYSFLLVLPFLLKIVQILYCL